MGIRVNRNIQLFSAPFLGVLFNLISVLTNFFSNAVSLAVFGIEAHFLI